MVYAVLAVFVAQSVVAQGHWHVGSAALAPTAIATVADQPNGQQPGKGDPKSCPICHMASVAGAFFLPSTPGLRVPSLLGPLAPRAQQAIAVESAATHWRSRAPPSS